MDLFTLYKSSIEHNVDLSYSKSSSLLLKATANDIPAKTEKSKVLHSFEACFNVITTKNNQ